MWWFLTSGKVLIWVLLNLKQGCPTVRLWRHQKPVLSHVLYDIKKTVRQSCLAGIAHVFIKNLGASVADFVPSFGNSDLISRKSMTSTNHVETGRLYQNGATPTKSPGKTFLNKRYSDPHSTLRAWVFKNENCWTKIC